MSSRNSMDTQLQSYKGKSGKEQGQAKEVSAQDNHGLLDSRRKARNVSVRALSMLTSFYRHNS